MTQYKVVKDVNYDGKYNIYKKVLWFWISSGTCWEYSGNDEAIIETANTKISPKTLYLWD